MAVTVSAAVLAPVGQAQGGPSGCTRPRLCLNIRLPAAIGVIPGLPGSRAWRIEPNGRVEVVRRRPGPYPADSSWFPASGVWFRFEHEHLVIGRGRRELWRSTGALGSPYGLGDVIVGSGKLAFSYAGRLYLASLRGVERPVTRGEYPLGWTAGGLFTYRQRGGLIRLRSLTGRLLATVARRPQEFTPASSGGRLYFLAHRCVMVVRGDQVSRVARLSSLGLGTAPNVSLQLLGRLVELQDARHLVLLHLDGTKFAGTNLARRHGHLGTESSSPIENHSGSAVAFTVAFGQTASADARHRAHGQELVYLLRSGARSARLVHTERIRFFAVCERGADLQWHGSWILYTATEGNAAAIDTAVPHRSVELGRAIRRLLGGSRSFSTSWA